MSEWHLTTPLTDDDIEKLRAGDRVYLTGIIYTARDAAHKRLVEAIEKGNPLPIELNGAVIYYAGPAPAPPGYPIGSIGPTTSYRMDKFTPQLHALGVKATIGKGERSDVVKHALKTYKAVYFVTAGGVAALLAKRVKRAEVIAYEDLGPEAIRLLEVDEFPCFVAYDMHGGDIFVQGVTQYARK